MPGILLCLCFAGLALLAWPGLVERFVALEWQVADMRPVLHGLQALFVALALTAWLARRKVNVVFERVFPTPGRVVRALLTAGGTLLVLLAAGEIALRLLHLPFAEKWAHLEVRLSRFDEELGWVYRPDQTVMQGKIPVHLDSIGARVGAAGYEHDTERPAVLFVGGSFTFGHGLPYEQSFTGRLAARDDLPFEAVNLGVQAYGTDQALLRLKRHFHRYDTRVVVYTFVAAHILRNSNHDRRLLYPQARFIGTKPMFGLRSDSTLRLEHEPVLYEDLSYSRLWAYARMVWLRRGPPDTPELTRALIREMKDFTEANGAEFLVVNWVQDTPMSAAYRDIRPLEGMDLVVIDPSVGAPPDWNDWKFPRDGHPDARAHQRVAELLAAELRTRVP